MYVYAYKTIQSYKISVFTVCSGFTLGVCQACHPLIPENCSVKGSQSAYRGKPWWINNHHQMVPSSKVEEGLLQDQRMQAEPCWPNRGTSCQCWGTSGGSPCRRGEQRCRRRPTGLTGPRMGGGWNSRTDLRVALKTSTLPLIRWSWIWNVPSKPLDKANRVSGTCLFLSFLISRCLSIICLKNPTFYYICARQPLCVSHIFRNYDSFVKLFLLST